jgi:hypothetical protein
LDYWTAAAYDRFVRGQGHLSKRIEKSSTTIVVGLIVETDRFCYFLVAAACCMQQAVKSYDNKVKCGKN